jgi:PHD/YefM family antitoxin component YafN of YafNO toxin-antitoxin module
VPTASISDIKRSPSAVFELAKREGNAVYAFSHGKVSGVMLTREQYESMAARIEQLEDQLLDTVVAKRIAIADAESCVFTDVEVRGDAALRTVDISNSEECRQALHCMAN